MPDRYPEQTRFHMESAHAPTTEQEPFQTALRKRLNLPVWKKHFTADVENRTKSVPDHFDAYLN